MSDLTAIKQARDYLDEDHTLSVFVVRDLQVTKAAGLSDLAWAMHQNYCVRSEVEWLLDELEEYLRSELNEKP